MTSRRFYIQHTDISDENVISIRGSDAHHLCSVLRARPGEPLVCRDDKRRLYEAVLTQVGKRRCSAKIVAVKKIEPLQNRPVHCLLSVPRPQVLAAIIPKLTEMGIASLQLVFSERSFFKSKARLNFERYAKIASESLKQCARDEPLLIHQPCALEALAEQTWVRASYKLFAWENESTQEIDPCAVVKEDSISFFIGPEGGISHQEAQCLETFGFNAVSLGSHILKVETAVISAAALLLWQAKAYASSGGDQK